MTILQQNVTVATADEWKRNKVETRWNYMSCISLVCPSLDYLLRIWSPGWLFEWGCDVDETVLWHRELWQQSQEPEELLQWLKWQWCTERWELGLQQTQSSDRWIRWWPLGTERILNTFYCIHPSGFCVGNISTCTLIKLCVAESED